MLVATWFSSKRADLSQTSLFKGASKGIPNEGKGRRRLFSSSHSFLFFYECISTSIVCRSGCAIIYQFPMNERVISGRHCGTEVENFPSCFQTVYALWGGNASVPGILSGTVMYTLSLDPTLKFVLLFQTTELLIVLEVRLWLLWSIYFIYMYISSIF